MEMVAGRKAGGADFADEVAGLNVLTGLDVNFAEMKKAAKNAAPVIEKDDIAAHRERCGKYDGARRRRIDGRAAGYAKILSFMSADAGCAAVVTAPFAEIRRDARVLNSQRHSERALPLLTRCIRRDRTSDALIFGLNDSRVEQRGHLRRERYIGEGELRRIDTDGGLDRRWIAERITNGQVQRKRADVI